MDPASMNPEQLTSTPTKQDLLYEEFQTLAMKTHLQVQQREYIRGDLVEGMKFVPPFIAVKGPMVVINTGTSIFQLNARRLRRPLDTMDQEEPPDSCKRTGALVSWLSCECQIDVWELFSDNSYLSAKLGRQGLMVAAPADQRTKKAEGFSPQALQGFWSKIK